jgi:hypothetical protein
MARSIERCLAVKFLALIGITLLVSVFVVTSLSDGR